MKPFIATPCYGGVVASEHRDAMIDLAVNLTQIGLPFYAYSLGNESVIQRARNECAAAFFEDESSTHLFFVDADIAFRPQDFYDLLTSGLDFVLAPYRKKCPEERWTITCLDRQQAVFAHPNDPCKFFIECAEGGTGFMCLSRKAMCLLRDNAQSYTGGTDTDRPCWDIFRTPIDSGVLIGEDQYVCRQWRALGGSVWCALSTDLRHVGHGMVYRGEFSRQFEFRIESSPEPKLPVGS